MRGSSRSPVTTLSHHDYFGGPATNPDVNIPNLLKPATMLQANGEIPEQIAAHPHLSIH